MKTYKLVETTKKEVETVMNTMAKDGWEVVSVTYWSYWTVKLLITFAKDV